MSSFFWKAFENKKIVIPRLQRDYVQGKKSNKAVALNFIEQIIQTVEAENRSIDLNYIYGSYETEMGGFVPVDGQQRLTTLWLLYLYVFAMSHTGQVMPVGLEYLSREYSKDFCKYLLKEMSSIKEFGDNIEEAITDCSWFISSWQKDSTVAAMLNTLQIIHLKLKGHDFNALWSRLTSEDCPVTFSFLNLNANGISNDLYIKMNGRGRPLSEFENLKSFIDGLFEKADAPYKEEFVIQWKRKMDNDWTTLFWTNRNMNQEKPYEIDDEQIRFFYNMLFLFWTNRYRNLHLGLAIDEEKRKVLSEFLDCKPNEAIEDKVLEHISRNKGFTYPVYVVEQLNLIIPEFVQWLSPVLDALVKKQSVINKVNDYLYFPFATKDLTLFYQIFTPESYTYEKAALGYAIINSLDKPDEEFIAYMRILRNLVINSDITGQNLNGVLKSIEHLSGSRDIIADICHEEFQISAFAQKQIEEERNKARLIKELEEWIVHIHAIEEHPYFVGQIRFMLDFMGDEISIRNFTRYADAMCALFDQNGLLATQGHRFERALLCFAPSPFGKWQSSWRWDFLTNKGDFETWKDFISDSEVYQGEAKNSSIRRLIDAIYTKVSDFKEIDIKKGYVLKEIIEENHESVHGWIKHFVHHASIWDYIEGSSKRFVHRERLTTGEPDSVESIVLMKTTRMSGAHRELHIHLLYEERPFSNRPNWDWGIWEYGETCTTLTYGKKVRMDICFSATHDSYYYNLRLLNNQSETQSYFSGILQDFNLQFRNDEYGGRWYSDFYSHDAVILELNKLMDKI